MLNISYDIFKERIISYLSDHKYIVFATASNNKPKARTMSYVNIGLDIFMQTDIKFEKYQHIIENNNIALCIDNYQFEGIATIVGKPFDKINIEIINLYKQKNPNAYKNYSHLEDERLIKISIDKVTAWIYVDGKPYREFLDVNNKIAKREAYF